MNAIQFIKDRGIEKARKLVGGAPKWAIAYCMDCECYTNYLDSCEDGISSCEADVSINSLKRLVDSADFINCFDDLDQAKFWFDRIEDDLPYVFKGDAYDNKFYRHKLKQAIADWESIYAN